VASRGTVDVASREEVVMATTTTESTSSVRIDAPIEQVWQAVTTPTLIKEWFFGVDTEAEWKVGGVLVHRGDYQGRPYVDRGEILEFLPPRRLVHSHWSDVSGKPDRPENHEIVTWDLAERGDGTELTITERNLPSEEAVSTSESAWKAALDRLKALLEP
jgi:uncharacterized protein YndB with AHSA1/START domain